MKNVLSFISLLTVLIFTTWYLFTYVLISDEDRVQRIIYKGKNSIETGSILSLPDLFAPSYTDKSGADKAMVLRALYSMMDETENRSIQITRIDVDVDQEIATVNLNCQFDFDTESHSLMGRYYKQSKIRIELQKIKGRWKIVYTQMQRNE